jgi:hypothetical protein
LDTFFCHDFIESSGFTGTDGEAVDLTNLTQSDELFDYVELSEYILPSRNKDAWRMCLDPVFQPLISITSLAKRHGQGNITRTSDSDPPPSQGSDSDVGPTPMFHTRIIQTGFGRNAPVNKCFPAPHDREENITWTREERLKAGCGPVVQDIDELDTLVSIFPLLSLPLLSSDTVFLVVFILL